MRIALALLLLCLGGAASAQPPNAQRVPQASPAIAGQAANKAADQPQPANSLEEAVPIRIVEDPNEAQRTQHRERNAARHDADDLDAQNRAATAAEEQIPPAWIAVVLGFLSTAAVAITLLITTRTSRAELRAYVMVDSINISPRRGNRFRVAVRGIPATIIFVKNSGQTPAYKVAHIASFDLLPTSLEDTLTIGSVQIQHSSALAPGGTLQKIMGLPRAMTPAEIVAFKAGDLAFFVWGRIEYNDTFGKRHVSTYRSFYRYDGFWPLPNDINPYFCKDGNDSD